MKVKSVKLSEIFPYYDNPRDNTNAVEPTKESIKRFGYNRHCANEAMQLVRDGTIIEHETINGTAFSIAGTEIKYNAEYGELI